MHDLDKFVTSKNIGSISTFEDFPHRNDVSENLRDTHVADIMQYVNSLELRPKDSIAANERRDEHDHPWPRNPDLKELKKKSMISRICQLHIIVATILCLRP